MTQDMAQQNLKEPAQVDWENYGKSAYQAPPPAEGPDGQPIIYFGVADDLAEADPDDEYLNFLLDPIKVVRSGSADGYTIRFTRASTKPFTRSDGTSFKGNPNKLANYLRACGLQAKPQTNSDYRAAVKATKGRPFPFVIDWEAYNKDTGERIKGYRAFPLDPATGLRKSVLKAGDVVSEVDNKGNITGSKTVQSEVLFANARLRYFKDAAPKGGR